MSAGDWSAGGARRYNDEDKGEEVGLGEVGGVELDYRGLPVTHRVKIRPYLEVAFRFCRKNSVGND